MSDFWNGYMAGESQARVNQASADLADTVVSAFLNLGRDQQVDIEARFNQAHRSAAMYRAALCGVAAAISALSPAARAEMERALAKNFGEAFATAATEQGYRVHAADPQIDASRQSILKRAARP